jgi:outer membrane protein, heavy metal efflux system
MRKCFGIRRHGNAWGVLAVALGLAGGARGQTATGADTGPSAGPADRVPVRALLSDTAQLVAWLESRHPEVAAAGARVQQAEAALRQSRVIPNPILGVGVGGMSLGERNPSSLSYGETMNFSIGVSETIEIGKRGPRAQAATLRRDAARAAARNVVADRLADSRDALARVVYLGERGHVLQERLASATNVAQLERVRLEHGDISGIDMDRLELDVSAVLRQLADNQAEASLAQADCATLLTGACIPGDATMDAVDGSVPVPESFSSIESMVGERPDVRAMRLSSSASRADAVLYRHQAIPDPTVGVAYLRDFLVAAGNQPSTLAATVSLPLPLFDHGQHLSRQAESAAAELGHLAKAIEVRALADAHALLQRRSVLREKLDTLTKIAIPRADGVLKSSDEAYHRGQLSLTDLLLVRREHASLVLDALDTRYELFTVRNALHRALGIGVPMTPPASNQRSE